MSDKASEALADHEELRRSSGAYLQWSDRRRARLLAPAPRVLEVVSEESDVTEEDPGHRVIEGDNRQALVSLRNEFANEIDVVLIDPPYNTGKNDFRYSDTRFLDPDADTAEGSYVTDNEAGRHTKWLNEMAPTLRLIKDLMSPSGVIMVHINDRELPRLLMLMEDIFDEPNHLGTLVWKGAVDNNPTQIAVEHEYIVVYARDKERCPSPWNGLMSELVELMNTKFSELKAESEDHAALAKAWRAWIRSHKKELPNALGRKTGVDERGPYQPDGDLANPGRAGYFYDIVHPATKEPVKTPLRGWRYPPESMDQLLAEDRIQFGKDHKTVPGLKRYLQEDQLDRLRSVIEMDNRTASYEIKALFPDEPGIFKNPKPAALEEYLLSFVASKDAIVLDCFAGSGTTGHAVMRLNKRDGGHRRFILVERGEPDDPYATTLTAERLRRARKVEDLPGGFTFYRVGDKIDYDGLLKLRRESIAEAVLQSDATGRGGTIKPVAGKLVIGKNRRGEAICLSAGIHSDKAVDGDELREMLEETEACGLKTPMRVYGVSCEIYEDELFSFFQLPDEVLRNLNAPEAGWK